MTPHAAMFLDIARQEAKECYRNPEVFIQCLVKLKGTRDLLMWVYCVLIGAGVIIPIEQASEEKKWELWNMAIADAGGRLRREEVKRLARVLFMIEQILNQ
jgi:hypothetical protein